MNKAAQRMKGKQKPYGGKARYAIYVTAGLFGLVFSIVLLSVLFTVGVLVMLGYALVSSAFHSKSRRGQFLLNIGKTFFWSAFVSITVLFILFLLATLGTFGSL